MPIVTTEECDKCGGDGDFNGQTCPSCNGTGTMPIRACTHAQTEANVKAAVLEIDDVLDKCNDIKEKLDEIKAVVDAL